MRSTCVITIRLQRYTTARSGAAVGQPRPMGCGMTTACRERREGAPPAAVALQIQRIQRIPAAARGQAPLPGAGQAGLRREGRRDTAQARRVAEEYFMCWEGQHFLLCESWAAKQRRGLTPPSNRPAAARGRYPTCCLSPAAKKTFGMRLEKEKESIFNNEAVVGCIYAPSRR